jgi:hypothetical protein
MKTYQNSRGAPPLSRLSLARALKIRLKRVFLISTGWSSVVGSPKGLRITRWYNIRSHPLRLPEYCDELLNDYKLVKRSVCSTHLCD